MPRDGDGEDRFYMQRKKMKMLMVPEKSRKMQSSEERKGERNVKLTNSFFLLFFHFINNCNINICVIKGITSSISSDGTRPAYPS